MFPSAEIATALTEAWVRNGTSSKGPKEVADFYCALYDASEQAQGKNISKLEEAPGKISKADSRYMVVQFACAGVLMLFAAIAICLQRMGNDARLTPAR